MPTSARVSDPAIAVATGSRRRSRNVLSAAIASVLAAAAVAGAQEKKPRVIEEIVVTAQKTEQSLQDVPLSVSTIGGDFIRETGLTDLADVLRYTPNVQFSESSSLFASFNIRGFATPPLGIGLEPSVGLVIDDVPYGRSTYAQDAVFDVERVEVLRGPQGALFGKNTVGGVINFTTAAPSFEPFGYVTLAAGSTDSRRAEGGISFPVLDDVLAARLSFRAHARDMGVFNTTRDEVNDVDELSGRVKLLWRARDDLDVHLSAWASEQETLGTIGQLRKATERSLEVFRAFDPETETDEYDGRAAVDARTFSGRRADALSAKAVWSAGSPGVFRDLEVAAIGAWSRVDAPYAVDPDFSPIGLGDLGSDGPNRYEQASLELRVSGLGPEVPYFGGGLDFVGGLYGQTVDANVRQLFRVDLNGALAYVAAGSKSEPSDAGAIAPVPQEALDILDDLFGSNAVPLPDLLVGPVAQLAAVDLLPPEVAGETLLSQTQRESKSIAGFLQGTWHVRPRWDVTLGARLGYEDQQAHIFSEAEGIGLGAALAEQRDFEAFLDESEIDFSPKLALSHHWTDDVTFFGVAARGFKAGGFANAPLNDDNLRYDSEKATSFEAGVKSKLLGGSVVANAAFFYSFLEDLQVRNFTGVTFSTENADEAVSRGLELDFQWLPPLDGMTVFGSLGWIDAWFERFPNGTAVAGSGEERQDLSGRPLPNTPEVSASLSPSMLFPVLRSYGLGGLFGVDLFYRSRQFLDADLDPNTIQPSTFRVDARLGLLTDDGRWSLVLNAKNLTAEKESLLVIDQSLLEGNYIAFPLIDEPQFFVDLRYDF